MNEEKEMTVSEAMRILAKARWAKVKKGERRVLAMRMVEARRRKRAKETS
jgi:hypothetical protein